MWKLWEISIDDNNEFQVTSQKVNQYLNEWSEINANEPSIIELNWKEVFNESNKLNESLPEHNINEDTWTNFIYEQAKELFHIFQNYGDDFKNSEHATLTSRYCVQNQCSYRKMIHKREDHTSNCKNWGNEFMKNYCTYHFIDKRQHKTFSTHDLKWQAHLRQINKKSDRVLENWQYCWQKNCEEYQGQQSLLSRFKKLIDSRFQAGTTTEIEWHHFSEIMWTVKFIDQNQWISFTECIVGLGSILQLDFYVIY